MNEKKATGRSERRRLERLERDRLAYWEQVRLQQSGGAHPANPQPTPTTTSAPVDAGRSRKAAPAVPLTALSALVTLLLSVLLAGATPLAGDRFRPYWLLVGLAVVGTLASLLPRAWRSADTAGRLRASLVAVVVVAAGVTGAITQNSVDGKVQLRGSRLDRAVHMQADLEEAVSVLSDNQRLLYLSSEQALGLVDVFEASTRQAVRIGEIWNPATVEDVPLDEFSATIELVNLTAARQATAFEYYLTGLSGSDPTVETRLAELTAETETLLNVALPDALATTGELLGARP